MGKVLISEDTLKKIVREAVEHAILNEGLFGPFNLGKRGKTYKDTVKAIEKGQKSFRTRPTSHYDYSEHKPEIVRGDKKHGVNDQITYKNFKGEPVTLTYNKNSGFLCAVGEPVKTMYVSYLDMLDYRERGWTCRVCGHLGPEYEDKWEVSLARHEPVPIEQFEYNRDRLCVADYRLAEAIYSWCIKVCKSKKHVQFLKNFLDDTKDKKDKLHPVGYSAYHFFLSDNR